MILTKIKNKQGLTLPQILIASFLTFIVATTASDLIFTSAGTTDRNSIESEVHKEGLFTTIFISNDLTRAGDLDYGTSPFTRSPFDWSKTGNDTLENDELAIRFYNTGNNSACDGNTTIGVLTNHYKLDKGVLKCNNNAIIKNVERFNVIFGADLNGDGTIDRYVKSNTANDITLKSNQRIISLRFSLLIKSEKGNGVGYEKSFSLVNGTNVTYNDNIIYKYFEREVMLRNML